MYPEQTGDGGKWNRNAKKKYEIIIDKLKIERIIFSIVPTHDPFESKMACSLKANFTYRCRLPLVNLRSPVCLFTYVSLSLSYLLPFLGLYFRLFTLVG